MRSPRKGYVCTNWLTLTKFELRDGLACNVYLRLLTGDCG